MSSTAVSWLEEPLSIELTTAELMADLDEAWATWEPSPDELLELSG
jgi:hypothetical protein